MTSINFTDEEIEGYEAAKEFISNIFDNARHIIAYPDAYNKAEVLGTLEVIVTLMSEAMSAGDTVIQGSIEIDRMTSPPTE